MTQQGVLLGFDAERAGPGPLALAVRALVRGYDAVAHTAVLQPLQSLATYMHGVPVSREVGNLAAGDRVLVLLLDQHNGGDAVVVCRY
jgi:hypothetical protein